MAEYNARIRTAYKTLKEMGVPVIDPDRGWGGYFAISAESGEDAPDGESWADYWQPSLGEFGVHQLLVDTLTDYGLYAEWVNPGVLGVYDI